MSSACLRCRLPVCDVVCVQPRPSGLRRSRTCQNLCLQRSRMWSIIMQSTRRLQRKSYAWVKRTAWPIWQTCSRRCSLLINIEPYANTFFNTLMDELNIIHQDCRDRLVGAADSMSLSTMHNQQHQTLVLVVYLKALQNQKCRMHWGKHLAKRGLQIQVS